MKLWLITARDDNGEDQSWFIRSSHASVAVEYWINDIDASPFDMSEFRVWQVPKVDGPCGLIPWHSEVREVEGEELGPQVEGLEA